MGVRTQASDSRHSAYKANVLFRRQSVVLATVHVVGSENGLAPWALCGAKTRTLLLSWAFVG
ncbi:hypothetical protein GCM10022224_072260 [Nonomuraea antimicrobica]|uniref:Uncharacterized protein n=1 Tax=Nonomuraea antimicrobica TaxID=561173 RepID=A0ABP7CXU8_9ACTN